MTARYTRAQFQRRRARRDPRARSADTASVSTSVRRTACAVCRILPVPGRRNDEAPMAVPTGASSCRDSRRAA